MGRTVASRDAVGVLPAESAEAVVAARSGMRGGMASEHRTILVGGIQILCLWVLVGMLEDGYETCLILQKAGTKTGARFMHLHDEQRHR